MIMFYETTLKPKPSTIANEKRAAEDTAEEGAKAAIAVVEEDFEPTAPDAPSLSERAGEALLAVKAKGADLGERFNDYVEKATVLSEQARTIIQTPQRFAEQIYDAVGDLTFAFTNTIDAFNAQLQIFETYRSDLSFELNGSESRRLQVQNNEAISLAVENACVMQAGIAALSVDFDTLDDAITVRKQFEGAVRTQQLRNGSTEGWDDVYRLLSKLLGSVTKHINEVANLPTAIDYEFGDENVSFVLAQDFYGDADRGDEIVQRNAVRNPLFCNRELELLSE